LLLSVVRALVRASLLDYESREAHGSRQPDDRSTTAPARPRPRRRRRRQPKQPQPTTETHSSDSRDFFSFLRKKSGLCQCQAACAGRLWLWPSKLHSCIVSIYSRPRRIAWRSLSINRHFRQRPRRSSVPRTHTQKPAPQQFLGVVEAGRIASSTDCGPIGTLLKSQSASIPIRIKAPGAIPRPFPSPTPKETPACVAGAPGEIAAPCTLPSLDLHSKPPPAPLNTHAPIHSRQRNTIWCSWRVWRGCQPAHIASSTRIGRNPSPPKPLPP
jgi:hypothetical protein